MKYKISSECAINELSIVQEKVLFKNVCKLIKLEHKNHNIFTIKNNLFNIYKKLKKTPNIHTRQIRCQLTCNIHYLTNCRKAINSLNNPKNLIDPVILNHFTRKTNNLIRISKQLKTFNLHKKKLDKYFSNEIKKHQTNQSTIKQNSLNKNIFLINKKNDPDKKNLLFTNKYLQQIYNLNNNILEKKQSHLMQNNEISGTLQKKNNLIYELKKEITNIIKPQNFQTQRNKINLIQPNITLNLPLKPNLSKVKNITVLQDKIDSWVLDSQNALNKFCKNHNTQLKNEFKYYKKNINNAQTNLNKLTKTFNQSINVLVKQNIKFEKAIKHEVKQKTNRIKIVINKLNVALIDGLLTGNIKALTPIFELHPEEYARLYLMKPLIMSLLYNREDIYNLLLKHLKKALLSKCNSIQDQLLIILIDKIKLVNYYKNELSQKEQDSFNNLYKNLIHLKENHNIYEYFKNSNFDILHNLKVTNLLKNKLNEHVNNYPNLLQKYEKSYKKKFLEQYQKNNWKNLKKYFEYNSNLMGDKFLAKRVDYRISWSIRQRYHQHYVLKIEKRLKEKSDNFVKAICNNKADLDLTCPINILEKQIIQKKIEPIHCLAYPITNSEIKQFNVPLSLNGCLPNAKISPVFILAELYKLGKFKTNYKVSFSQNNTCVIYDFKTYFCPRDNTKPFLITIFKFEGKVNKFIFSYLNEILSVYHKNIKNDFSNLLPFAYTPYIHNTWYEAAHKNLISCKNVVNSNIIKHWQNKVKAAQITLYNTYKQNLKKNKHIQGFKSIELISQQQIFSSFIENIKEYNRKIENLNALCKEYKLNLNKIVVNESKNKISLLTPKYICNSTIIQNILKNLASPSQQKLCIKRDLSQWQEKTSLELCRNFLNKDLYNNKIKKQIAPQKQKSKKQMIFSEKQKFSTKSISLKKQGLFEKKEKNLVKAASTKKAKMLIKKILYTKLTETKHFAKNALLIQTTKLNNLTVRLNNTAKIKIKNNKNILNLYPIESRCLINTIQNQIQDDRNNINEYYHITKRYLDYIISDDWAEINNFAQNYLDDYKEQFRTQNRKKIRALTISLAIMAISYGSANYFIAAFNIKNPIAIAAVHGATKTLTVAFFTDDYKRLHKKFLKESIINYFSNEVSNMLNNNSTTINKPHECNELMLVAMQKNSFS